MKGKNKTFIYLDPTVTETRHRRVQFMLDDDQYGVLESAATMQGVKPGDLAGDIFRRHILPELADEVARLRELSGNVSQVMGDPPPVSITTNFALTATTGSESQQKSKRDNPAIPSPGEGWTLIQKDSS